MLQRTFPAASPLSSHATASPSMMQHWVQRDIEGDGPTVFAHACKMGLEGIVSKRKDSPLMMLRVRSQLGILAESLEHLAP
jgi:hypothetical protein